MLKKLSQLTFLAVSLISTGILPAQSVIPQMGIQETFIEGEFNQVNQILNQNIILGIIYLADREESLIPNFNIQDSFNNNSNEVNQTITQNFPFFPQESNNFDLDNFNLDLSLNTIQSSIQITFLEGNNNFVVQQSQQNILDFFWFDEPEDDNLLDRKLEAIIEPILFEQALDTIQSSVQDLFIFGNENLVNQEVNQNIINLLLLDNSLKFNQVYLENLDDFFDDHPAQLVIQETFIINQGKNNQVNQVIKQTINDFFFLDATLLSSNNDYTLSPNKQINPNFDIERLISNILDKTVINANQINQQNVLIIGDDNQTIQVNNQEITVSVPEYDSPYLILFIGVIVLFRISKKDSYLSDNCGEV